MLISFLESILMIILLSEQLSTQDFKNEQLIYERLNHLIQIVILENMQNIYQHG